MLRIERHWQILCACLFVCSIQNINSQVLSDTQTVATQLTVPWNLEWMNRKEIIFSQLNGDINVLNLRKRKVENTYKVEDVANEVQSGLMGISVDQNFRKNQKLYLMYTYYDSSYALNSRVISIQRDRRRNSWGNRIILLDSIPASSSNLGGRIEHTADGYLFITVGDRDRGVPAQDTNSITGKVLRIHDDGRIPTDNPFKNSPIWTLGHRNPQGLVFTPFGWMISEHGTFVDDEINILKKGGNYGWPEHAGITDDTSVVNPIIIWSTSIAPSGIDYQKARRKKNGILFVSSLKEKEIQAIEFNSKGIPGNPHVIVGSDFGRIRDVLVTKKWLYFCTSNCDIYGKMKPGSDRIVRVKRKR